MLLDVFLKVLDMTKSAGVVILAVMLARLLLKRAPKVFAYGLWGIVLLRLICPFMPDSAFSLLPKMESAAGHYPLAKVQVTPAEAGLAAYRAVGDALNGGLGVQHIRVADGAETVTAQWGDVWLLLGQYVWLAGMLGMAVYAVVSCLRLRHRLTAASLLRDNIYLADGIPSPFVMGIFVPKIYLPADLPESEREMVLLHEQHHLRRGDHILKALAFAALCVHWIDPLVWAAFLLAGRDMEMSCDEAVVKQLGEGARADYAASLLRLAVGRQRFAGMPLAFGEGDPKGRIRNLARWRKPGCWVIAGCILVCGILAVCLLTNPAWVDGKLAVSMDMAIADHEQGSDRRAAFFACDYQVLGVRNSGGTTTVYAWVFTQGYAFDGEKPVAEYGSHIPTAITFDTADRTEEASGYEVLEYWVPRDGSYYAADIRDRFPITLWGKALDSSGADRQRARCLEAAEAYFASYARIMEGQVYGAAEVIYQSPLSSFLCIPGENTPDFALSDRMELSTNGSPGGEWVRLGIMTETVLTAEDFDPLFISDSVVGWAPGQSAAGLLESTARAYTLIHDRDTVYYLLIQEDGGLYLAKASCPEVGGGWVQWVFRLEE